jgi:hypothetical protein
LVAGSEENFMRMAHVWFMLSAFAVLAAPAARGQEQPCGTLPAVVQHAEPIYPPLARQTRIAGDVRLKITTDGESVTDVQVDGGHPLLRQAAVDNVRTWKFAKHPAGCFEVIFRYKLLSDDVEVKFLESPSLVTLEARPPKMIVDYASLNLGTWNAEFTSTQGKLSRTLKLTYTGPKGQELNGRTSAGKNAGEEIEFGYKDGDFLTFAIKLRQTDGKRVETFFVGKMTKDKIVGTFVDDNGVTGDWTAARVGY